MGVNSAAPTRATNNLTLAFDLIAVPVQLFKSTEETKAIERKQFHRTTGNPIGYQSIDKVTKKAVDNDDIVLKVMVEDTWVEVTDEDLALATTGLDVDKHSVPIDAFIPLSAVGEQYVVDTGRLYQARPAPRESGRKKIVDPMANKAFALLLAAMAEKKAAALFHVGLRGLARYAVLMPDGMVQFLFFDEELREQRPYPETAISDAELEQALMLLGDLDTPELVNDAKAKIDEFLATKAKDATATPAVVTEDDVAPVLDLTAALTASVAAAKKRKKAA